ncbi:MAG: putative Ig domain-containing protein [Candidatus Liptonbacteria bacterium]|nr:putative Ig domain-containing protein [Candidatus Liptonbacteria bacterium]
MQYSDTGLIFLILYLAAIFSTVLWFRKVKKRGEKIPLKARFFAAAIVLMGPSVILTAFSPNPESVSENSAPRKFHVSVESANVRECPELSCKVIDTLFQNTELAFPGDLYDKYPDWAEVTFQDGMVGYVSKSTLTPEESRDLRPRENEILLAKHTFDPLEVGGSYSISFCLPVSARSGATCGGETGETQTPVGGSPPYSFVKSSGFLPPGMSLELNGLLSGSPTVAGTYNFRICAKDLQMNEGCEDFALLVKKDAPATQTARPSGKVSVDSIVCRLISRSEPYEGGEPYAIYAFEISLSGTVTGPVGSLLSVYSGTQWVSDHYDKQLYYDYYDKPAHITTASWTGKLLFDEGRIIRLQRKGGDPATTQWEAGGFITSGQRVNGFPLNIEMRVSLDSNENFGELLSHASSKVLCSP